MTRLSNNRKSAFHVFAEIVQLISLINYLNYDRGFKFLWNQKYCSRDTFIRCALFDYRDDGWNCGWIIIESVHQRQWFANNYSRRRSKKIKSVVRRSTRSTDDKWEIDRPSDVRIMKRDYVAMKSPANEYKTRWWWSSSSQHRVCAIPDNIFRL